MTDISDLRELGVEDLRQRRGELDDRVFRLRIQKSMGQTDAANKMRQLRRDRARVMTLLRERELADAAKSR
jgi:large subunit ribosomal protein L29